MTYSERRHATKCMNPFLGHSRIVGSNVNRYQQMFASMLIVLLTLGAAAADDSSFTSSIAAQVKLNDGNTMPVMGLGVALTAEKTYSAVTAALEVGYRLIDTAAEESYGNEDTVGQAVRDFIKNHNLTRSDIYVTTKLWDADHGFYKTLEAFDESYDTLQIANIDLYLMHSPFRGKLIETWDAMLYIQSKRYAKSIGVSNFGVEHLQAIKDSGRPLPAVNQIEMHPLVYPHRRSLIEWCRIHNVQIQAYGSLMHGYPQWLTKPQLLVDMAGRYPVTTTAQILLRWALQHGFAIIPKSSKRERIVENAQLYNFTLSNEDMELLDHWGDRLDPDERNLYIERWGWNPIDEASVKLGKTHYWPKYEGVTWDDDDDVAGPDDSGDTGADNNEL